MSLLKLGIIGMSEGNGHPYSWSAIFNGYQPEIMKDCPYPVIPDYLSKQKFPEDAIPDARVTHIWTQDKTISRHIAAAANIETVVDNYQDMIGKVDAILLARDDYEFHFEMSKPFIKAGLPIYIDKPLSIDINAASKILSLQKYEGQVFTCSALRYAKEFRLDETERKRLGAICYVDACSMKSWEKYGAHIVEPVLAMIGDQGNIVGVSNTHRGDKRFVFVDWESGLRTTFITLGDTPCSISVRIFGTGGFREMIFLDTFFAFKEALKTFIEGIQEKKMNISKDFIFKVITILEQGTCSDTR